MKPTEKQEG